MHIGFFEKKNNFDNQRRFGTYRLCIYKSIMNNIIVQRNFKRKFPQKRWKVEIFLRLSGSVYVPNKTVNRGNFSKYIDRVYTIIRDSRVRVKEDSAWRRREKGDLYLKYTHKRNPLLLWCHCILHPDPRQFISYYFFVASFSCSSLTKKVAFRKESIHIENAKSQKKLFCPPNIVFLVCMFEGT